MLRSKAWGTEPLLSRAFSLLSIDSDGVAEILVKGTGKAARRLQRARPGEKLALLGPLGRSFPPPSRERTDWLVAGGVGLAPLLMQAVRAEQMGVSGLTMFYGGRTQDDLVLCDRVRATGVTLVVATEDGSVGHKGYVTDAVAAALDGESLTTTPTLMACGPEPMLESVARLCRQRELSGYLSLEGEMACGIGACLACAVPCQSRSYRYACIEGPVFDLQELRGPYGAPRD